MGSIPDSQGTPEIYVYDACTRATDLKEDICLSSGACIDVAIRYQGHTSSKATQQLLLR